jgi:uncharacterized protein (TIGR02118 family)
MPKVIVLVRRNSSLSPEAFRDYYENHHVPLATSYIGEYVESYRRNYPTADLSRAEVDPSRQGDSAASPSYDCITEFSFRDEERMQAMFAAIAEPEAQAVIAEDEAKFMDRDAMRVLVCEETGG